MPRRGAGEVSHIPLDARQDVGVDGTVATAAAATAAAAAARAVEKTGILGFVEVLQHYKSDSAFVAHDTLLHPWPGQRAYQQQPRQRCAFFSSVSRKIERKRVLCMYVQCTYVPFGTQCTMLAW